jgi:hypothetical protein
MHIYIFSFYLRPWQISLVPRPTPVKVSKSSKISQTPCQVSNSGCDIFILFISSTVSERPLHQQIFELSKSKSFRLCNYLLARFLYRSLSVDNLKFNANYLHQISGANGLSPSDETCVLTQIRYSNFKTTCFATTIFSITANTCWWNFTANSNVRPTFWFLNPDKAHLQDPS